MPIKNRIVGRVFKYSSAYTEDIEGASLSDLFEKLISHNKERGYELESWQLSRVPYNENYVNETIIAVFVKAEKSTPE